MLKLKFVVATAALAFLCTVGLGSANAANIVASETLADVATLVGTQFDSTPFTSTSAGESADGSGAFVANTTATGMALVVFTEGAGGPNSDWLQLIYAGTPGGPETVTVHWRSDADPGGLPALPTGVVPQFVVETGANQEITALLAASATASGFSFPSNITIQAGSDAPEVVPEPATLALTGIGLALIGRQYRRRRRSSNPQ